MSKLTNLEFRRFVDAKVQGYAFKSLVRINGKVSMRVTDNGEIVILYSIRTVTDLGNDSYLVQSGHDRYPNWAAFLDANSFLDN